MEENFRQIGPIRLNGILKKKSTDVLNFSSMDRNSKVLNDIHWKNLSTGFDPGLSVKGHRPETKEKGGGQP